MLKGLRPFVCLSVLFYTLTGCSPVADKKNIIHFEVVNDSLYVGKADYKLKFTEWKNIYEQCLKTTLFKNALYAGLQENVPIGSISNQKATNINSQFSIFDTSNSKNIYNLFALINQANCYTQVSENLQDDFYQELLKSLKNSDQYQYLAEYIDTGKIIFKITSFADVSIRPDSLVSLVQRTKDTSLLHLKDVLLIPGNVLLVRTAMIYGFLCEFPIKKQLPLAEEMKLKKEVFFNIGTAGDNGRIIGNPVDNGRIKILENQNVQVFINKYYTVFGQFYIFKEDENE